MQDKPVTLAAVTGAHGVAGDVRLKLLGEGLAALKAHRSFNEGALTVVSLRDDGKGGAIARFAEVKGRDAAEALRGTQLKVARTDLPPLEDGEFYHADLEGLSAVTPDGQPVGRVTHVVNFGAGDIIEIALDPPPAKGVKVILVPLTTEAVPEWNEERLVVAPDFASLD